MIMTRNPGTTCCRRILFPNTGVHAWPEGFYDNQDISRSYTQEGTPDREFPRRQIGPKRKTQSDRFFQISSQSVQ